MHYQTGTQRSMVDKVNRFLFFLFLLVSVFVHSYESFKVGREIFGIENVVPLGNDDNVEFKTPLAMEETIDYNNAVPEEAQTNDYNNIAYDKAQTAEDKNPLINLL